MRSIRATAIRRSETCPSLLGARPRPVVRSCHTHVQSATRTVPSARLPLSAAAPSRNEWISPRKTSLPRAAETTQGTSQFPPLPNIGLDDTIMFQAFGWESCHVGGWYGIVQSKIGDLKVRGHKQAWGCIADETSVVEKCDMLAWMERPTANCYDRLTCLLHAGDWHHARVAATAVQLARRTPRLHARECQGATHACGTPCGAICQADRCHAFMNRSHHLLWHVAGAAVLPVFQVWQRRTAG